MDDQAPTASPSRRWFSFRLRTAFVGLTAACLLLALLVGRWRSLAAEHEAALKLSALPNLPPWGGGFGIEFEVVVDAETNRFPESPTFKDAIAIWRAPIKMNVDATRRRVTDNDLRLCNSLRRMAMLRLDEVDLNDYRFSVVTATDHLERLVLRDNPLHDVSAARIGKMGSLTWLDMSETKLSDTGMRYLSGLPKLEFLLLDDTKVTDSGVRWLTNCRTLQFVSLRRTAITDAGLAYLGSLPRLSMLSLNGTQVTDAGVRTLLQSTSRSTLEEIDLSDTRVTNDAIAVLEQFPKRIHAGLETQGIDWDKAEEFSNRKRTP